MVVYRCEDSLEGIFTAIYRAYEEKRNHTDTLICITEEVLLFSEDIEVMPGEGTGRKGASYHKAQIRRKGL